LVSFDFHLGIGQARPSSTSTSAERKKEKSEWKSTAIGASTRHLVAILVTEMHRGAVRIIDQSFILFLKLWSLLFLLIQAHGVAQSKLMVLLNPTQPEV
jgi:hypothetical protein